MPLDRLDRKRCMASDILDLPNSFLCKELSFRPHRSGPYRHKSIQPFSSDRLSSSREPAFSQLFLWSDAKLRILALLHPAKKYQQRNRRRAYLPAYSANELWRDPHQPKLHTIFEDQSRWRQRHHRAAASIERIDHKFRPNPFCAAATPPFFRGEPRHFGQSRRCIRAIWRQGENRFFCLLPTPCLRQSFPTRIWNPSPSADWPVRFHRTKQKSRHLRGEVAGQP